jgi:taurine dioxygenase
MGTMLLSKIIPEMGGDTCFASMSAAYDSLSDKMQSLLSGLEAIHDFLPFKGLFPKTEDGWRRLKEYEIKFPPCTHPVVRVHPITKRKSIFVNPQFTIGIKGMDEVESRMLLDRLYRLTSILEIQYRHRWKPDMLVFWDNRSAQHAAVHDYYPQRRLMQRVTISGDRPEGDGPVTPMTSLRRPKTPSIMDFKDRPKRQHEM